METSTPKPRFFLKKRDFFLFLLVLGGVAVLLRFQSAPVNITVSGLDLEDTRASVSSHLKFEDYRFFNVSQWEERWYRMDSAGINVVYDEDGSVHRLEGGVAEINGEDVTHWTVEQLEARLGPAPLTGRSSEVGETDQGHLSYPQHHLLIYLKPEGNCFLLFESGR